MLSRITTLKNKLPKLFLMIATNFPNGIIFFKLIIIITVCELVIMILLETINLHGYGEVFFDSITLSILVSILAQRFIFAKVLTTDDSDLDTALSKVEALSKTAIVSMTDEKGLITYVNQIFCDISGYQKNELLGKDHRILNSNYHSKDFFKSMWTSILAGEIWRGEVRNKKKNGEFYWVYSNIVPILNKETNKIKMFISIRFEITNRKLLEEALKDEQLKTLQLHKLADINKMSTNIAHEINNPLAVVLGRIEIIKRKVSLNSNLDQNDLSKDFNKLSQSVDRITKIIQNVREFSKKEDQLQPASLVSAQTIIENTLDLINEKAKTSGIKIELQIINEFIFCIPSQIQQALLNLLNNSIYEVEKLDDKWIKIETTRRNEFVEIAIIDSGKGISKEIQENLTIPFFTTKPVGDGIGLGLSVTKKIIESSNGKFYYDKLSQNTKFIILLPTKESATLDILNIEEAILAHSKWKQIILDKLTHNTTTLDHVLISDCTQCHLGKWLKKSYESYKTNNNFQQLINSHKNFHSCTGNIIKRIQDGETDSFNDMLAKDSDFEKYSHEVIFYLNQLENDIKNSDHENKYHFKSNN